MSKCRNIPSKCTQCKWKNAGTLIYSKWKFLPGVHWGWYWKNYVKLVIQEVLINNSTWKSAARGKYMPCTGTVFSYTSAITYSTGTVDPDTQFVQCLLMCCDIIKPPCCGQFSLYGNEFTVPPLCAAIATDICDNGHASSLPFIVHLTVLCASFISWF